MTQLGFSNDRKLLELIYAVGQPYISFTDRRNPNEILGFGTWAKIPDGHAIVAAGGSYAALATGGEETVQLTVDEMPIHAHGLTMDEVDDHVHNIPTDSSADGGTNAIEGTTQATQNGTDQTAPAGGHTPSGTVEDAGGDQPHNNMPPYIVAYAWRRTA